MDIRIKLMRRSPFYKWNKAKRFHPSTFDIRNSAVLRFAVKLTLNPEPLNPEPLLKDIFIKVKILEKSDSLKKFALKLD